MGAWSTAPSLSCIVVVISVEGGPKKRFKTISNGIWTVAAVSRQSGTTVFGSVHIFIWSTENKGTGYEASGVVCTIVAEIPASLVGKVNPFALTERGCGSLDRAGVPGNRAARCSFSFLLFQFRKV